MHLKNNKTYIVLGGLLIILGSVGLFMPAISGFFINDNLSFQDIAMAKMPTFEDQFVNSGEDLSASTALAPVDVKDRLVISKANINMPVFLGDNEKILEKGGWLYPFTSRPGLGGNSVIFGHRYKYLPPISNTLYNLDKVEIGDELIMVWQGKEYKYKVFEKKVIEPTDLSVIQPTSDSRLTVITCTPLFTTKQRLVIVGSLVQ